MSVGPIASEADPAWDAFLESTPLGQFQQSSKWARAKASEGWHAHRATWKAGDKMQGGAQILWKRVKFWKVGFVNKGPLLQQEDDGRLLAAVARLQASARELGLAALIVQPPDSSALKPIQLVQCGFSPWSFPGIIDATAVIDLNGGLATCTARMNRRTRQEIRQGRERGVRVSRGTREDLPRFFQLMAESSLRQRSHPNPAQVEGLERLWDEFGQDVLLGLARVRDEVVAGLLMIRCGQRLTLWKKGWNAAAAAAHTNTCLHAECLAWAVERGVRLVDFVGLDRQIAERILAGQPLTEEQERSRHTFNLRLGAEPRLLPPAQIHIFNPVIRAIVNAGWRVGLLRDQMRRRLLVH